MAIVEARAVWGPQLWAQLHTSFAPGYLWPWMERVPCEACRQLATAIVHTMPPNEWLNVWGWRLWTWQFHNAVRRHLGQAEVTLEQAVREHGWQPPAPHEGSD